MRIQGWQYVVKEGAFAVGDRDVFLEIGAVPPDAPAYRFLWTGKGAAPAEGTRPASFRIGTRTLRGCLPQGLFLSLPEVGLQDDVADGTDVTQRLGVTKYDPPLPPGFGDLRAPFPGVVPRTDEERVQSAPGVLDELRGHPYHRDVDGVKVPFTIRTSRLDPGASSVDTFTEVKHGERLDDAAFAWPVPE